MPRKLIIRSVMAILAIFAIMLFSANAWLARYLDAPMPLAQPTVIEVRPGSSLRQVASLLEAQVGLNHPAIFSYWAQREGFDRSIRTGEFAISPGMSPRAALEHLVSGQAVQYPITFIEGTRVQDALSALWNSPKLNITLQGLSDAEILAAIGTPFEHLEGSLYPDTYFYTAGTSDRDLLRRASARLQQVLSQEWETRAVGLPLQTPYEALTLASIIEKESGIFSEHGEIAGVFIRRLHAGMRLQSDPTVIYGMGESYEGNIRRVDLETTTAYNTYRINGLPPTPIAMAGRNAIHASLNPSDGETLYFVATGDGGHHFSATLSEHNAAVRRYQLRQTQ